MNPIYRFFLQVNEGGEKIAAKPIYSDDLTLDYELESNQRFYRAKLSGKLTFVREDYAIIMAAAFDSTYYLYIEKSDDIGVTWAQYYKAMFMRTDCTVNTDDQFVSVQPQTIDQYNDVLAGLEKEYNLISLAPEIERITLQKRPLIQIYIPGENIVSCFLSGLSWEQDANAESNVETLESTYYFAKITNIVSITLSVGTPQNDTEQQYLNNNAWINNAVGTYVGEFTSYKFVNPNNGYYIQADNPGQSGMYSLYNSNGVKLGSTASLSSTDPTAYGVNFAFEYSYVSGYEESGAEIYTTFNFLYQSIGRNIPIMGRYLLDVETISDLNTYELPVDDIVGNNRNYRRAIGYAVSGTIAVSTNFSETPTEYGLANNGKYYAPPYSVYGQKFYPIARTQWGDYSIWFAFHFLDDSLETKGRKAYTLRDSYPVSSVISVLLKQFAPNITHEATPEYSRFLYSNYNPISYDAFRLFVTPKSNLLVGDYQTPTQKAPTTLQQFLDMLRNVYQCYWHIEENKLRIEHISWYKNGGAYNANTVVGYDLTQLENVRNGKKWAFGTSEYTFDKQDMPERYQFAWADDVTEAFEGEPIQVVSKYTQPGKIEEINIGNFTSDVDLMLLNPEAISQDGFVLLAVEVSVVSAVADDVPTLNATNAYSDEVAIDSQYKGSAGVLNLSASGGGTGQLIFTLSDYHTIEESVNVVSGYHSISGSVGGVATISRAYDGAWRTQAISVQPGETYIISGTGGGGARLYALLDANNIILQIAGSGETQTNLEINVTQIGTLYVNFLNSAGYSIIKKSSTNKQETDITFAANGSNYALNIIIPTNATGLQFLATGTISVQIKNLFIKNIYALPFVRYDVDNVTYYLQNGLLAMINLQPQYWLYDMPAKKINVNGYEINAYGIQRRKSQTLTFPVGNDDPDILQLVKTYIGNGQIDKLSINLSSRTAKATLKYDTE